MRNPETNLEAPAPTLKSVGKAENPLTIIPTPGTAPYNQKETPSAHFFVEREKSWTMCPTLLLFWGASQGTGFYLTSVLGVLMGPGIF